MKVKPKNSSAVAWEKIKEIGRITGFFLCVLLFSVVSTYAENRAISNDEMEAASPDKNISGTVIYETGETLPGVSIIVKGTTRGTTSDVSGNYTIAVPEGSNVLVFSFIGMQTKEVSIAGRNQINVMLKSSQTELDEIQVIGYGSVTRRENTSSVSTVKAKEIELRPVNSVMQTLQGKLSGVSLTNFSPGLSSPLQIVIRGVNSLSSGTDPLILVDGVIINTDPGGLITSTYNPANTGGGSNIYQQGVSVLNSINPNDIESVDVLKDADATAIYGSRGANGVILITTKKAKKGKHKFTLNASTGFTNNVGYMKRMNTQQYLKMRRDAFAMGFIKGDDVINPVEPTLYNAPDLLLWDQNKYTDFPKWELNNTAPSYNFDASVTGGTENMSYLFSGGYFKRYDTWLYKPYNERLSSRMQLNISSDDKKFKLAIGSILGIDNQSFTTTDIATVNTQASYNPPNFPLYKEDGSLYITKADTALDATGVTRYSGYNPLFAQYKENYSKTYNVLLNADVSYEIIEGLVAKTQISYNSQTNKFRRITPTKLIEIYNLFATRPEKISGEFSTNDVKTLNIEPQLTYTTDIDKAKISALLGVTYAESKRNSTAITVKNPATDDLLYNYQSGDPTETKSFGGEYRFSSLFARINANWDSKYYLNLTYRRDGSSRFGPNNKFGNFGSAGIAWIFSSEDFVKETLPFLSFGKLRASIGVTGNENIADFLYLALIEPGSSGYDYSGNITLIPKNYPNKDIHWEQLIRRDFGLELGFLNNRILLNTTFYTGLSSDLLVAQNQPIQGGYRTITGNFEGEVQNQGFEFDITSHNLKPNSDFSWTTKLNLTTNKNKLKSYPDVENSEYSDYLEVGRAVPSLTSSLRRMLELPYIFSGIDKDTGLPIIKDVNGDGKISIEDRGNATFRRTHAPTVWGGLTNTLSYKNLTLDVFLQFSDGLFTKWFFYNAAFGYMKNPPVELVDNYWTAPGDNKEYPRLVYDYNATPSATREALFDYALSDKAAYQGYYIRLKNIMLSYTLPTDIVSRLKLDNVRFYITGENIAVFTPEKLGKDPEIFWTDNTGILRNFTAGIQVNF